MSTLTIKNLKIFLERVETLTIKILKIFLGPLSALTIKNFENFSWGRGNPTFFNDIFDGIFFLGYHSGEFCIFINANFEFISDSYLARFFRKGEFALLKPLKIYTVKLHS